MRTRKNITINRFYKELVKFDIEFKSVEIKIENTYCIPNKYGANTEFAKNRVYTMCTKIVPAVEISNIGTFNLKTFKGGTVLKNRNLIKLLMIIKNKV